MTRLLLLFPTEWDARQLAACGERATAGWDVRHAGPPDADCPWDLDPTAYLERTVREERGRIDAVASSSDYPGATLAAAVAQELGLPGPRPEAVLRASHKYASRLAQRQAVPEATPGFALVDPSRPESAEIGFPCYVKPVKGAFSMMSRRIDSAAELRDFVTRPAAAEFLREWVWIFNRLVERFTDLEVNGSFFLAEELLTGALVTVEGFAFEDEVEIFGVVDSALQPGSGSFVRFDYPSRLPAEVQSRMAEIARRTVRALDLRWSMFNIEMIHDPSRGSIHIIEVNPRISGQFGDLYQKVDGANSYEYLLALAAGRRPDVAHRRGRFGAAVSVPLRVFQPCRVTRAPSPEEVRATQEAWEETLVWTECAAGQELADFDRAEDGHSARYAILNVGGSDPEDAIRRAARVEERLGFRFEPLG